MTSSDSLPRTAVPAGITDPVESARAELKAALAAAGLSPNDGLGGIYKGLEGLAEGVHVQLRDVGLGGDGVLLHEQLLCPLGEGASRLGEDDD